VGVLFLERSVATPRKREPAVIVPCSIRNPDPEHASVFGDAALRGAWLGLKVIAWQSRSASKGGRVVLSVGDRMWIAGDTKPCRSTRERNRKCREADALVRDLCTKMSWELHEHDTYWTVLLDICQSSREIPEQNQQIERPKSAPSEVRSQKSEVRSQKKKSAAHSAPPLAAPEQAVQPAPAELEHLPEAAPTPEQARAAKDKLEADVNKALNILADQPGGLEEKRLWLRAELRGCEAWCRERGRPLPGGLLSFWRTYVGKPERPYREIARKEQRRLAIVAEHKAMGLDTYATPTPPEPSPELIAEFMANNYASVGGNR
jgi:hypothetical protein